jgi:hypothetical protein
VSKNGPVEPFIFKNEHFTKTGSGQTLGKLTKRTVFPQGMTFRPLSESLRDTAISGTHAMHPNRRRDHYAANS